MGRRKQKDEAFTELQELLRDLDRMPGCERTKQAFREMLRKAAGSRMYLAKKHLVTPYRVDQARHLLDMGCSPTEVRARMVVRFCFSRDTAERVVKQALQRPKSAQQLQLALLLEEPAP